MSSPIDGKPPSGWAGPKPRLTDEEWANRLAAFREGLARWERDHRRKSKPRLKKENARLQYELSQAQAREAEAARARQGSRGAIVMLAVYLGGGFLLSLLFSGAHPARAWNGAVTASWWDLLAMFVYLGWSIGGIAAGHYVAYWFRRPAI
jgi:hypothetical protein